MEAGCQGTIEVIPRESFYTCLDRVNEVATVIQVNAKMGQTAELANLDVQIMRAAVFGCLRWAMS